MVFETLDIDMPKNEILHHMPKSMSKWIKDLKVRPDTVKIVAASLVIGLSNDFSDVTQKHKQQKEK